MRRQTSPGDGGSRYLSLYLSLPLVLLGNAMLLRPAAAQQPHYFSDARMPPGAVGQQQLWRAGPVAPVYYQPVRIIVPGNALVSVAENGTFSQAQPHELTVGLLLGKIYRFRIANIAHYEEVELFPSVEVLSRLHPPEELRWRYPIPVVITEDDLRMAMDGRLVTRVIYLEDPQQAAPIAQAPEEQPYYDADPSENVLLTADRLGRPMLIVRLGSRVPTWDASRNQFLFDSPPVQWPPVANRVAELPVRSGLEPPLEGGPFPRLPGWPAGKAEIGGLRERLSPTR
ncbi:MAG: hypothetical protein KatS3mg110_1026 [Pirellulaceae bacterium]|nr:MAG: hypothetical protein KatS3mg110_1026 [Pirellulaceae bacterium]